MFHKLQHIYKQPDVSQIYQPNLTGKNFLKSFKCSKLQLNAIFGSVSAYVRSLFADKNFYRLQFASKLENLHFTAVVATITFELKPKHISVFVWLNSF